MEVKKQKQFGREHGCSKLHTEADGQSAKSFPRDERLYGLHVENRIGKMINIWPAGFGRIMVIKHRGRKSGKECLTPVNYAIIDGEFFSTAGFGSISDWYRNLLVNPQIELWLPAGKCTACAEDISDSPDRLFLLRQVIIASEFAGPLFGINPKKLNDEQLDALSKDYRLVHFIIDKP